MFVRFTNFKFQTSICALRYMVLLVNLWFDCLLELVSVKIIWSLVNCIDNSTNYVELILQSRHNKAVYIIVFPNIISAQQS